MKMKVKTVLSQTVTYMFFSKTFEYKFTYIFPLRLLIWSNTKSTTSEMEMLSVGIESLIPNKFLDPICTIDSSEGFIGLNIFNFPSAVFLKLLKKKIIILTTIK